MNPFASPLAIIQRNIEAAMPVIVAKAGAVVVSHSLEAFNEQGWTDEALEPWTPRKSDDAKNQGRAILVKTGQLRRSIHVISATADSVTVGTDVPYARVHNEGFTGTVRVAGHIRMQSIRVQPVGRQTKMRYKTQKQVVTKHTKYMRIIQRKFLGNSHQQTDKIRQMARTEIAKCFKIH